MATAHAGSAQSQPNQTISGNPECSNSTSQVKVQDGHMMPTSQHQVQREPQIGLNKDSIDNIERSTQQRQSREHRPMSLNETFVSFNATPPLSKKLQSEERQVFAGSDGKNSERSFRDVKGGEGPANVEARNTVSPIHSDDASVDFKGTPKNHPEKEQSLNLANFFSQEVFQVILRNPTTAHRFLKFCQDRACGENMEFLQKVDSYYRLLDDLTQTLASIDSNFTATNASNQVNISSDSIHKVSSDIHCATQNTIPSLERIFLAPQQHIENLLATDIYPKFVKQQVTTATKIALAKRPEEFAGLGDCFCLTDPKIADNPLVFASDGFVSVTGYTRKDIIPRNCRFLQGQLTDPLATKRLHTSVHQCEESVELILNYRKNGDPFWNLLYTAPLFDKLGKVSFFLGGQINCSTTVRSYTDILRILNVNDDDLDGNEELIASKSGIAGSERSVTKPQNAFYKRWRKLSSLQRDDPQKIHVRQKAGIEEELLNQVGSMNLKTQVEVFYSAYSKYIVMSYKASDQSLHISHFSSGIIDILGLNLPNNATTSIYDKEIFRVLAEHSASPPGIKSLKQQVRDALKSGKAISVEVDLLTGCAEKKVGAWFGNSDDNVPRTEEKYVTHWTPLKNELGQMKWVVLTITLMI